MNTQGERVAVVGAASGIGMATATHLARAGARVYCLDQAVEDADRLARNLQEDGCAASACAIEVRDEGSVARAMSRIHDAGPLEALVNCVGITGPTDIRCDQLSVADFDLVYAVNLRGAFLLTKYALPPMIDAGYGRILHIASMAGKEGNVGMGAYSASKAGLIGLVKALGKECATTGVTINALAPAVIPTPAVEATPSALVERMVEKIPMGRPGTLDEAARLIAWIVSGDCSFTTGFTFDLSGGRAVY